VINAIPDDRLHHVIFAQGTAVQRGEQVLVPGYVNGHLRAFGALVPGTFVVLPEDENLSEDLTVSLDASLRPILLSGFTTRNLLKRTLAYRKARRHIHAIVARSRFIQIQFPGSFGMMAGRAAMAMNRTIYLDMHGSLFDPPDAKTPRPLRTQLSRRFYYFPTAERLAKSAKLLVAVSEHLHRTFPPNNAPKVVAPCTLIEERDIYERYDTCTKTGIEIFIATRMIESKGIHVLLRALRRLQEQSVPVRLKVAGVGDYLEHLQELSRKLGLTDSVQFLGGIPAGERLWALYRGADMVVLPSLGHYEGTPRMIIEAWAAGAPVVATTVGGIPSMVRDGSDGLLVPPGEVDLLAGAIRRVVSDAGLRRELIANGYTRVRSMTFEARVEILRDAFVQHLGGLLPGQGK